MDIQGFLLNGRYRIGAVIAEGGMSVVYRAEDRSAGDEPVAVKLLKKQVMSRRREDLIRFRAEAAAVSRIDHPGIVKLREIGEALDTHYLVMEYIEGQSLADALADGPFSADRALAVMAGIAGALEVVHRHGIIHRDIKPGNVLLAGDRTVLVDFGLAQVRDFGAPGADALAGTLAYIAPEQTGMLRRPVDERSDLYAAGALFYHLLTGAPPFAADDINALIHRHLAVVPRRPSESVSGVPSNVDRIVMKLLEKDPVNRYQSARGLGVDLARCRGGEGEFMPGLDDRSARLSFRTGLIGRAGERARLEELFDAVRRGRGAFCLVTGEAGSGKTRLAEELRDYVFSREGIFIDGKCSVQRNRTPYGPITEALDTYLRGWARYPASRRREIRDGLREDLGELGRLMVRLNPLLEDLVGPGRIPDALKPGREHKRFLITGARLLCRLAARERGMVILLDDVHWADEGTLALLDELMDMLPAEPLLVVATCREASDAGHPLRRLLDAHREAPGRVPDIVLNELTEDETRRFVGALLMDDGEGAPELGAVVHARTGGNPFGAIDLVRQFIVEQALRYEDGRWCFDQGVLKRIELSPTIVDTIFSRIGLLDSAERQVVSYAAVIGRKFRVDLLFGLCELEPAAVVAVVDKAMRLQILEEDPRERGQLSFVHDRLMEAFLAGMNDEERGACHRRLAAVLEENCGHDISAAIFDIANHACEGGDRDRVMRYAYPAGLRAREKHAHDDALRYFGMAIGMLGQDPPDDPLAGGLWLHAMRGIGEVCLVVGDHERAIEVFTTLMERAVSDDDRIYLNRQMSELYFKLGNWKMCEHYGREGLELLGERLPVGMPALVRRLIREGAVHLMHLALPALFVRRHAGSVRERDASLVRFIVSLAWTYILSDIPKYIHAVLMALNRAEARIGPSADLGMLYTAYGSIWAAAGYYERALRFHDRSQAVRREHDTAWGIAQTHQLRGFTLVWYGRYEESLECFRRAMGLFERVGDLRETGMCCAGLIHNYTLLGRYADLRPCVERYRTIAVKTSDVYGIAESWTYSAALALETGDVDQAEVMALRAHETSLVQEVMFTHCRACIVLGRVCIAKGDPRRALRYLDRARELYERNSFLRHYTVDLYVYQAQAHSLLAVTDDDPARRREHRESADTLSRLALRRTRPLPSHYGIALAARAAHCALAGRHRRALRLFEQGIAWCRRLGQRYREAQALIDLGAFLSRLGEAVRSRQVLEESYRISAEIGARALEAAVRTLLGMEEHGAGDGSGTMERLVARERLASLVKISQEVCRIADPRELLDGALARAIELAGARRGYLFMNGDGRPEPVTGRGGDGSAFSASIVTRVLESGEPVITTNAARDEEFSQYRSVTFHDLKSILCVPIRTGDQVIGACYLDNDLSAGVFTSGEAELLGGFMAQVAFALENSFLRRGVGSRHRSGPAGRAATNGVSVAGAPPPGTEEKLRRAIRYLEENYHADISRENLAASLDIHPDHFGKLFKTYTGQRLGDYLAILRIREAARRLEEGDETILSIAFAVGFESLRTFNRAFLRQMRCTPRVYRERHGTGGAGK